MLRLPHPDDFQIDKKQIIQLSGVRLTRALSLLQDRKTLRDRGDMLEAECVLIDSN